MANKKYYAWTDLKVRSKVGDGETVQHFTHDIKCGTEVSQQSLHLNDDQWQNLITSQSIRPVPYPVKSSPNAVSPTQHFKNLALMVEHGVNDPAMLESVLPPVPEGAAAE